MRRSVFEHEAGYENQITVTSGDHGLTIEVTEEVAIDTGNSKILCSITLPPAIAEQFISWIEELGRG